MCPAHRPGTAAAARSRPRAACRARARLTDQERQQEWRRNREQHRQARGQQDLHTAACVPLSEFDEAIIPVLDIGGRTTECQHCRAMIWPDEASRGHADLCCAKGRSCSCEALFPIPPQPLRDLLTSEPAPGARLPPATVSFRKHIRKYNSSLQMASSSINIQSLANGVNMIAIRGAMHHLLGPLAPPQGSPHQFAQLYIIDNANAQAAAHFATFGHGNVDLDRRTLQKLQQMLLGSNVYVQRFVHAMDLPPQDLTNYEILICVDGNVDRRCYNAPTSSEVASLMSGE